MTETQLQISYAPDLDLLSKVKDKGVMIASEGTDEFGALVGMEIEGLVKGVFCKNAGKVWQFNLTSEGMRVLL